MKVYNTELQRLQEEMMEENGWKLFDNLFTDWLVRTRINESREKVDQTCTQIQKIIQNLGSMQEESVRVQNQLEKELEEAVAASDAV